MMAILVEVGKDFVERDLVASVCAAAALLVRGVRRDSVDPRTERRLPPECVDLSDHVPERVLDGFFGIFLVARDPDRQAIRAVAERGDETLGGGRLALTQCFDEPPVTVGCRRYNLGVFDFHRAPPAESSLSLQQIGHCTSGKPRA